MKKFVSFFGEHSKLFDQLNEKAAAYAKEKDLDYVWLPQTPYDQDAVIEALRDADVGLIDIQPYNEEIFSKIGDRLKLLVRFGVGYDKVDIDAAAKRGICAARTAGANKTGVAEMALTQMLAARRLLMVQRQVVESGIWTKHIGSELIGGTIGILGFGQIGKTLAKLLQGFGCEILVYGRTKDAQAEAEYGVRYADLDEIFTKADAISVHLPYSEETDHLIGKKYLSMMKEDAVIVCTARGNIIDEDALYEVLKAHKIAGAGLDVFAMEPTPTSNKLIELDNIILTPHVASQTQESLWYTYKKAIDIAADFFAGRQLDEADLLNPDYVNYLK